MHSRHSPRSPKTAFAVSEFILREYRSGDEVKILATFNRVFAAVDPTFRPRSLEFWRWQFLENPSGALVLLAVTPEGNVVGQLANVLQRVALDGKRATFSQAVDSMSDPSFRPGLRRTSLQALLGNRYAETYAGPDLGQHALLWGAPVPAAWRIGKSLIRYEVIRTQQKLVCDPRDVRARGDDAVVLEETDSFPEDVALLFERCARERRAIAVRDRPQLDWRFTRHPERDYRIALARRAGELAGFAVFQSGSFDGEEDAGLVCDWLVPREEQAAARALLGWLAETGRSASVARLVGIVPDTSSDWTFFQRAGFRVAPTRYTIVGRQCVRGYDMRWMHRHWYYTLGDTDLV